MLRLLLAAGLLVLAGCAGRTASPAPPPVPTAALPAPPSPVIADDLPFMPARAIPDTASAAGCAAQADPAFAQRIPAGALDRALLDRAILFYSNRARCSAGLRPLGPDPRLREAATGHSADMVRLGFFGHTSPVPGRTTMGDRLKAGGVAFMTAAENLATAQRLEIGDGQPVYPVGQDRCSYTYTPRGQRVPIRTYDSLARNLVDRWMASPGHRRNLMNPAYTRHGASGAVDAAAQLCDSISATQLFAG